MAEWIKKYDDLKSTGAKEDIKKIIEKNTGKNIEEVIDKNYDSSKITCLSGETGEILPMAEACKFLNENKNKKITVMADYDADGVCSATILYLFLLSIGITDLKIRFPKRFSEGYGLSMEVINETNDNEFIITVDNGIAAVEEIKKAKEKNISVLIIDHHLKGEKYPQADFIIDPNAVPCSDFSGYCGAGLAYLFALEYYKQFDIHVPDSLISTLEGYAGIATVCDVMDIIGPNYTLVKNSLENIKRRKVKTEGLYMLMSLLNVDYEHVTEVDYGFSIGPAINAAGRLYDDGPQVPFELFVNSLESSELANWLVDNNNLRKDIVKVLTKEALENADFNTKAIVYKIPQPYTGINGIVAGRLAEVSNKPTFVCSPSENDADLLKGSARTGDNINLKELMDKAVKLAKEDKKEIFLGYGGHAGAAGFALKPEQYDDLKKYLEIALKDHEFPESEIKYYDLEINSNQVNDYMKAIEYFAPFGQGNPRPVFKINNILCKPTEKGSYMLMGKDKSHIKIFGEKMDLIGFDKAEDFLSDSKDFAGTRVIGYGRLSKNVFNGKASIQLETEEIEKNMPQIISKRKEKLFSDLFTF